MTALTMNWGQESSIGCGRSPELSCKSSARRVSPLWRLTSGQPRRLRASRGARWLRLREGELWVTADGRPGEPPPEDWWLSPGQTLRVPPGTSVLMEGWPTASFELLEEPSA
jgi:hypothetical protein